MRLYNKFCRSPGHRVPILLRKFITSLLRTLYGAMHTSASRLYSVQELVSSAEDSSRLCAAIYRLIHKVDQEHFVVW